MSEKKKYKYGVIIASDSRSTGERADGCIQTIKNTMGEDYQMVVSVILPDDIQTLQQEMVRIADEMQLPLLLTSGGTGLGPRDNTPEATLGILHKETPGISEAIRLMSKEKTPHWMLSRAVSGIRGTTLIINLPGSPKAVRESIEAILPALGHGLDVLTGAFTQH
ncbi:MAG: MogA/MoaB family molybdenum cofactor biosynthesis protein [Eubacteriaceae bacterium]|jgi:molybdenum cofactor synthesis domain-containing protein|nr:MogA/MoaB family molybdenum cofactor biosynthesis protein [Eubacteriaceae bacterium]